MISSDVSFDERESVSGDSSRATPDDACAMNSFQEKERPGCKNDTVDCMNLAIAGHNVNRDDLGRIDHEVFSLHNNLHIAPPNPVH